MLSLSTRILTENVVFNSLVEFLQHMWDFMILCLCVFLSRMLQDQNTY